VFFFDFAGAQVPLIHLTTIDYGIRYLSSSYNLIRLEQFLIPAIGYHSDTRRAVAFDDDIFGQRAGSCVSEVLLHLTRLQCDRHGSLLMGQMSCTSFILRNHSADSGRRQDDQLRRGTVLVPSQDPKIHRLLVDARGQPAVGHLGPAVLSDGLIASIALP